MATPGFYNDNRNRAFPFVEGSEFVVSAAIVDCVFLLGPETGFVPGTHTVKLSSVEKTLVGIDFRFTSDAPGLAGRDIVFTRPDGSDIYVLEYADDVDVSTPEVGLECPLAVSWSGYLVTGELTSLLAQLAAEGPIISGNAVVEPALLRSLRGRIVTSVNVANVERTRYSSPEGCRELCWPFDLSPVYVQAVCVTGPLRFQEGYNASLLTNETDNAIEFNAIAGGGEGEPCELPKLFADEEPPTGRNLIDGSLGCGEVIRSINGIGGKLLSVAGGLGISVTATPESSKLIVDIDTGDMAVCFEEEPEGEPEEPEISDDPCDCGPTLP